MKYLCWKHWHVWMYVCPKIYIRRALNKVTDAPRSQRNKNVFNARLKRSVDKSTERKEVGRLFQILAPVTAKLRSPNVLLVRGTTNRRSIRRPKSAPAGVSDELRVVSKVRWQLTEDMTRLLSWWQTVQVSRMRNSYEKLGTRNLYTSRIQVSRTRNVANDRDDKEFYILFFFRIAIYNQQNGQKRRKNTKQLITTNNEIL